MPNPDVTFKLAGFSTYEDITEFTDLVRFAEEGKVIVDWGSIEEDEGDFDPEGDNVYPIYDESDRSGHKWYPLAAMLATVLVDSFLIRDEDSNDLWLQIRMPDNNSELVLEAGQGLDGLTLSIL